MKGLRKILSPFAPDQSGAVSALFGLGGMTVILDAGGCTGNICDFDEPRWRSEKSAVFSAGLRDMDAIMGRDDKLAEKIADAAEKIEPEFIALIGTPVPAVTGTDLRALAEITEKETGLPVIFAQTNGMALYDRGASAALEALYGKFAVDKLPAEAGRVNMLGVLPQDNLAEYAPSSLGCIRTAAAAEKNIVASPSGMRTAKLLNKRFGTPYETACPAEKAAFCRGTEYAGKNVLVVHQHVFADTVRKKLLAAGAAKVTAVSWFMLLPEISREGDIHIKEEDEFKELAAGGNFDIIIADIALKPLAKDFAGIWTDAPHFALSGRE